MEIRNCVPGEISPKSVLFFSFLENEVDISVTENIIRVEKRLNICLIVLKTEMCRCGRISFRCCQRTGRRGSFVGNRRTACPGNGERGEDMKKKFRMQDLDCAHCAAKMEEAIKKVEGVNDASISFMTQKLMVDAEESRFDDIMDEIVKICRKVEPDCRILI